MKSSYIFFALLAAALYALNAPFSKLLLSDSTIGASMMAAFLYLGAGIGLCFVRVLNPKRAPHTPITKKEFPYIAGMIVLDIAAPILLMLGLERCDAASASLLNNFEIVATSVIALCIFREKISRPTWLAIALVTAASMVLGIAGNGGGNGVGTAGAVTSGTGAMTFGTGALFILGACVCWGFENNCTRSLSARDPAETTMIKGLGSGTGALIVALISGEFFPAPGSILPVLLLGFVAYGLSINFYILAQRGLGAAKTSAFYSAAPFLGVLFSFLILGERPAALFWVGCAMMAAAAGILVWDSRE